MPSSVFLNRCYPFPQFCFARPYSSGYPFLSHVAAPPMTDSRGNEKAEFKGLRRASFARALHVPAIGRRKHVEIVEHANRNAFPSRNNVEKEPQRGPSPNPVTVSIAARGAEHNDGDEGAEIPDIPLRRSHVKRVSADYSGSSLGTLERMLTTGGTPDASNGHLFGPINPNAIMSSGGEKRYSSYLSCPCRVRLFIESRRTDDEAVYPMSQRRRPHQPFAQRLIRISNLCGRRTLPPSPLSAQLCRLPRTRGAPMIDRLSNHP